MCKNLGENLGLENIFVYLVFSLSSIAAFLLESEPLCEVICLQNYLEKYSSAISIHTVYWHTKLLLHIPSLTLSHNKKALIWIISG